MVETAAVEVGAGAHCWGCLGGSGVELEGGIVVQRLWVCRGVYKKGYEATPLVLLEHSVSTRKVIALCRDHRTRVLSSLAFTKLISGVGLAGDPAVKVAS